MFANFETFANFEMLANFENLFNEVTLDLKWTKTEKIISNSEFFFLQQTEITANFYNFLCNILII